MSRRLVKSIILLLIKRMKWKLKVGLLTDINLV